MMIRDWTSITIDTDTKRMLTRDGGHFYLGLNWQSQRLYKTPKGEERGLKNVGKGNA